MPAGSILPVYRWLVTNDGVFVPGAKAYFYASGTSTPQAVYTNAALSVAHAQPVVADAEGVLPVIYLSAVSYRVFITDAAGATIFPAQDDIYSLADVAVPTQLANLVYAGPASGGAATPTFRALVAADLPSVDTAQACQGRLTLTSGLAVTTADVTAAGTLYFTPYLGNIVSLYDGSLWEAFTFTERSLALTLTTNTNYDVFLYDNAGTLTLEVLAWTNDTTRATALASQDGVLVKSGAVTRRYLGTIRASGTNTTEDSFAKRFVWNLYNRVDRPVKVLETTNSWTYSTGTWRQANGAAGNQIAVVTGVAEDALALQVGVEAFQDAGSLIRVGIGEDSTSVPSTASVGRAFATGASARYGVLSPAVFLPALGYHFYAWLEFGATTTTWYGDDGGTNTQSGLVGTWRA